MAVVQLLLAALMGLASGFMEGFTAHGIVGPREVWGVYGAPQTLGDVETAVKKHKFESWVNVNTSPLSKEMIAALQRRGVKYEHFPLEVPKSCTKENAYKLNELLLSLPQPIVLQCASGTRASAVLAIHNALRHNLPPGEAVEWTKIQGLKCATNEALKTWISQVAEDNQAKKPNARKPIIELVEDEEDDLDL